MNPADWSGARRIVDAKRQYNAATTAGKARLLRRLRDLKNGNRSSIIKSPSLGGLPFLDNLTRRSFDA
jgi:hypothetical protein